MLRLEVETNLTGNGARRHVVRAAESGEEVVNAYSVRQIDHGEAGTPLEPVAVEDIVVTHGNVEQIARPDRGGLRSSSSVPGAGIFSRVRSVLVCRAEVDTQCRADRSAH